MYYQFLVFIFVIRFREIIKIVTRFLVRISQASHATHDTKHIVVRGIDANRGGVDSANRVVRRRDEERRVINA